MFHTVTLWYMATPPTTKPATLRELAAAGWRVFPCRDVDDPHKPKAPRIGDNLTAASCDPEMLRVWWQRWPSAPIGFVPASAGLVVLDFMPGVDIADLPAEWQETQLVRTPSGSLHAYFAAEAGVEYGNGKRPDLGAQVDVIRHADGYVIIPPTPGYKYIGDVEPLTAPAELAQPAHRQGTTAEQIFGRGASQGIDDRDTIPAGDQEAAIHARAFRIARMRPRPSEAEANAMLWQFVVDRCPNTPGREKWQPRHVADKIARAYAVPIEQPVELEPKRAERGDLKVANVLTVQRKVATYVPGMSLKIPAGSISVLTGQQGAGKGTLLVREAVGVAAAGGGVLVASDEDSVAYTLRPRLEVASLELVGVIEPLERVHLVAELTLPDHVEQLVTIGRELGVRLLVVDPWTNHVGNINVDRSQELRSALNALAEACDRTGMVALLVAHPNKNSENPDPLERVAHASALTQVARSAYWIVKDPRIDEGRDELDRLIVHVKHNLTARHDTAEARIETRDLIAPADTAPLLVMTGTTSLDWLEVHKIKRQHDTARPADQRDGASQLVTNYLATLPTRCATFGKILEQLEPAGVTRSTLTRAGVELANAGKIDRTSVGWYLLRAHTVSTVSTVSGDGEHEHGEHSESGDPL
jgi:energy-coupling factor transporter ATP-binding protein EcfA2